MARIFISVSLLLFAVFASGGSSYDEHRPALRVEQRLAERATYLGGWPLAAVPCPADAPVICSTGVDSQINQQCCPSGNTCFSWPSTIPPVCCPTSQNCVGQLHNLPVCANSSWNMYALGGNDYFCCENGQIGVIPLSGYAGICQGGDQVVTSSLLATLVDQVGGTAAASFGSSPTHAGLGSTATNTQPSVEVTGGATPTGSSGGNNSPSGSSSSSSSSSSTQLGSGAIAGIAVGGGIVIAAIIFVSWKSCSRKPQIRPNYGQQTLGTYGVGAERPFQSGSPPLQEYKASPVVSPQQPYSQPYPQPYPPAPTAHEVLGETPIERAEMEH